MQGQATIQRFTLSLPLALNNRDPTHVPSHRMSIQPLLPVLQRERLVASGMHLRLEGRKQPLKAVSYGPFPPNARGEGFPDDARLAQDLKHIRSLGLNAIRVYDLPTDALLREARRCHLRLIAGVPWTDHTDFLSDTEAWHEIKARVQEAARQHAQSDRVAVLLVGNEIEKTLVRWMGPPRVKRAMETLVALAKQAAPQLLVGYATYPSTEYIIPDNADIVAVNVYLEEPAAFETYLRRLMNLADGRPLLISEFGLDVATHSEAAQAETWQWMQRICARNEVTGTVWFSYSDEWFRGGEKVRDWKFGLVTEDRSERAICGAMREPRNEPQPAQPLLSVVVCTYNGARTLAEALRALAKQTYTHYEVLVIDDGSTDDIAGIASAFHQVLYHRVDHAGLSAARNSGMNLAKGEIIVYTDDDCAPDEDWLLRISEAFDDERWVAAGGPNLSPPPRTETERCVAAAPGGPCQVLLNDEDAEHLPGCNLAIRRSALEAIGDFDPVFTAAGDDVDICWRLREAGGKLRYVPGAMVWHHRRFTLKAYLKQQIGYGKAEALLMRKHPQRFGSIGGARWRGMIYGDHSGAIAPTEGSIFHGPYGTGAFHVIYGNGSDQGWWGWISGVLWVAAALICWLLGAGFAALSLTGLAAWLAVKRAHSQWVRSRLSSLRHAVLLWIMCLVQPIVREWARLHGMVKTGARPSFHTTLPDILPPIRPTKLRLTIAKCSYWSATGKGREDWLAALRTLLMEKKQVPREDDGWRWFDIELAPLAWLTVTEYHGGPRRLTRIALLWRLDWRSLLFSGLLLAAAVSLHWIAALAYLSFIVFYIWLRRRSGLKLVEQAALQADLQHMEQ